MVELMKTKNNKNNKKKNINNSNNIEKKWVFTSANNSKGFDVMKPTIKIIINEKNLLLFFHWKIKWKVE